MCQKFLPYGHQLIQDDDIEAVREALLSDFLTTGPAVETFEHDICQFTGAKFGVAVSSGTAALHAAMYAIGISKGDEVIVPPLTFAATANAVLYCNGTPVFADVDEGNLLISPQSVEAAITPKTKAIVGVDYAGHPCDWDALREIAVRHGLALIADACHALGATYKGISVGTLADITIFSFHPVKHITTGEGGMTVTNDAALAQKISKFRAHGINTSAAQREKSGGWFYEMQELGYNYRISDLQCALGSSQLKKLAPQLQKRNELAKIYDEAFVTQNITPLRRSDNIFHAHHLYVVKVANRDNVFMNMRKGNIGVNVHYVPVYLHPYYQNLGYKQGLCPIAEAAYKEILTLPLWPGMTSNDSERVIDALFSATRKA